MSQVSRINLEKMKPPRILVATLVCGEAELPLCVAAVKQQENVQVEHVLLENLPELEAHQKLFNLWNDRRSQFDLFVKLDADTVLGCNDALLKVWKYFQRDSTVTGLQAGLLDYFTDSMIAGLNCFSPEVSFSVPNDPLFCDRIKEHGHKRVLKPQDLNEIYPIAKHCVEPHLNQAFHFGSRRWMKGQVEIIQRCLNSWQRYGDEGRLWALIGARQAFFSRMADASYQSDEFVKLFKQTEKKVKAGRLDSNKIISDITAILNGSLCMRVKRLACNPKQVFLRWNN